jgi:hypothetical protein
MSWPNRLTEPDRHDGPTIHSVPACRNQNVK